MMNKPSLNTNMILVKVILVNLAIHGLIPVNGKFIIYS